MATQQQIQEWKAKFGETLSELTVKVDEKKTATYIIRKPDSSVLNALGKYQQTQDTSGANKVLISNCVLFGDMELLEKDGSVYASVLSSLNDQIKILETEVKKL